MDATNTPKINLINNLRQDFSQFQFELGECICSSGRLAGPRACIEVYVESHSDNLRELQADGEVCHIIREQNIYGPNVIFRHVIGLDPTTDQHRAS
jgi:hypothetical protein